MQCLKTATINSDILFDQAEIAKIGEKSYRSYIRHHLKKNPWFDVGIQLALGMPLDQQVLPSDSFFLPALVHNIIAGSTLSDGRPLVAGTSELYRSTVDPINDPIKISPPLILALLLLAIELSLIYLGCIKKKGWAKRILNCYEFALVVLNFLFGLLIVYLWFISDHTATKGNLNLLWCCPLSILFRFKWISAFMAAMGIVFLLVLMVGLQSTCWAFIPLVILFIILFGRNAVAASFDRKTAASI